MARIRKLTTIWVIVALTSVPNVGFGAIPIAKIIQEGVKKVIKAVDLKIQRLQTKTIWLQNAQKVLENKLNELKLKEIADWSEKHRKLFQEYYEELWKVKNAIATYQKVKYVLEKQESLVNEYRRAWVLLRSDKNFTPEELKFMEHVYAGILEQSLQAMEQMSLAINSFKTQMTDGKRLEIISRASDTVEILYTDIRQFNNENLQLSISRSKDKNQIELIKNLYGIQ